MSNLGKNIYLVGFMGAGKSTVGRRLARRAGYHFVDLDQQVVALEGKAIPEIFTQQGEVYFRDCETRVLMQQASAQSTVFATGGGIVGRAENREQMRRTGRVIYLRASWPTIMRRLSKGSGRPLADPEKGWDTVEALWRSRQPWYEEADHIVDTDDLHVHEVVGRIISLLNFRESGQ